MLELKTVTFYSAHFHIPELDFATIQPCDEQILYKVMDADCNYIPYGIFFFFPLGAEAYSWMSLLESSGLECNSVVLGA